MYIVIKTEKDMLTKAYWDIMPEFKPTSWNAICFLITCNDKLFLNDVNKDNNLIKYEYGGISIW